MARTISRLGEGMRLAEGSGGDEGMHEERVREIVGQHGRLGVAVSELRDEDDLHGAGLTSLATVGLMLALEDAFDIEFPDSMLSRRTFGSIASLAAAVEELTADRVGVR
jgi:acyl carrier protein